MQRAHLHFLLKMVPTRDRFSDIKKSRWKALKRPDWLLILTALTALQANWRVVGPSKSIEDA
jgi:hypothetical protein